MARWWSSSASDRRIVRIALAMLLPLALAACGGRDRASAPEDVPPATADDVPQGTLPTPDAAPGTSVTGMPTSPPPPAAVAEAPAAAPEVATAAPVEPTSPDAPLPAPVDTASAPADGTPPPATSPAPTTTAAPTAPVDASGAGTVVTQYMAALSAGAFAKGQGLWATTPNDSAVLQLARGSAFNVSIGAPLADAAGHVAVPVDIHGKADDGSDHHLQATYSLQRAPNGGPWRIQTAAVREASP